MEIIYAVYGGKTVTETVKSLVSGDKLYFRVGNHYFGDPQPGVVKSFSVHIKNENNQVVQIDKKEGQVVAYPPVKLKKLGIWYSNVPAGVETSTLSSLKSIEKAAKDKADIITCVWKPIPGNPFHELLAWTRTYSHLNQILQILQCLYTARSIAEYEYVSLLEHDLLYPEDYFDFPEIPKGKNMNNANYIGAKPEGFQKKRQNDRPLSQMSFCFNDAISHFEHILKNALLINAGNLEPDADKMPSLIWTTQNPSVHLNHMRHFTSHYAIYGPPEEATHPYWGEAKQYFNAKEKPDGT